MDLFEPPAAKPPAKAAGAFRTISEVAQDLDVPQHVLRFWESKFTQVKPLKRGGGRRYYRPEDVTILRRIRQCLYEEGYTIKGVQKLLREGGLKGAAPQAPKAVVMESAAPQPEVEADQSDRQSMLGEIREELVELRDMLARGAAR